MRVGILQGLRLSKQVARLDASAAELLAPATTPMGTAGAGVGIRSPWTDGQLTAVVWADILGVDTAPVTRAEAMKVPAVAKARMILAGSIARLPLRAMRGDEVLPDESQPSWLYRTDGPVSPWHRMAWTVDDLLHFGWSLWAVDRGTDGAILNGVRAPRERWQFDDRGRVLIDDKVVSTDQVLLIPGPGEGLLTYAGTTIRAARSLELAWAGRIRNPIPAVELHATTPDVLTDTEIDELIDAWCKARLDPNGAVTYTPSDIEVKTHGESSADMFVEARNAVRLDVANFTGLPGAALDGSLSTASLTYVTQDGKRSELAEALQFWTGPIEARLSQDDVVPRGQRVRFDASDLTTTIPSPTGPTVGD